ncbi:MAG: S8 family serine peptidase, partial [Oligoflexales bacterium]|nr:S8 family serine peptidase [Oligoflexales bacterium]
PDDPDFGKLYNMQNTGQTGGTPGADIKAVPAWELSRGSKNVLVGIIDTGILYTHPDLSANYWENPGETGLDASGNDKRTNGIDDDSNGYIDDYRGWDFINNDNDPIDDHGHGSHCAGVIGAKGNNGIGIAGINWDVSLVALKVFNASGSTTTDALVSAIEYSNALGVNLTSNSWGGGQFSQVIHDAIKQASDKGILFIAASGNDGRDADTYIHYPSGYEMENIISVAATDHNDKLADYSNFGVKTVDVAAPGSDIYSTVLNDAYETMSGTSMATPHVAGLAALIKAKYPNATYIDIKNRILNNVDIISDLQGRILTGGRINAYASLEDDLIPPNEPRDIVIEETGLRTLNVSFMKAGDDGDQGSASRYEIRFLDRPITGESEWTYASMLNAKISPHPKDAAGGRMLAKITDLDLNQHGYFAIRAFDNAANRGKISESVEFETKKAVIIYRNNGDNLDGMTAEPPWGTEIIDGNSVLSDSPGGG